MPSRSALAFQSSVNSTHVFLLAEFVYISYLTHFATTSLVIFAKLCILHCYDLGKEFQSSSHFCAPFCLSKLNVVGAVNHF